MQTVDQQKKFNIEVDQERGQGLVSIASRKVAGVSAILFKTTILVRSS